MLGGHSLGFLHRLRHGKEDAVEQNGGHDEVVEELVRAKVDAALPGRAPRTEQEERVGRGESVDVVFSEALRHHAERLKQIKIYRHSLQSEEGDKY